MIIMSLDALTLSADYSFPWSILPLHHITIKQEVLWALTCGISLMSSRNVNGSSNCVPSSGFRLVFPVMYGVKVSRKMLKETKCKNATHQLKLWQDWEFGEETCFVSSVIMVYLHSGNYQTTFCQNDW